MKSGFTLTGTDNDGVRHRYSFIKNEKFKKVFRELLINLGFEEKIVKNLFIVEDETTGEASEVSIHSISDHCAYYKNKQYEIDIFYGSKKIILVIRTNQKNKRDRRTKLLNYIENLSGWIDTPKVEQEKVIKTDMKMGSN
jgi:hypothetical protein